MGGPYRGTFGVAGATWNVRGFTTRGHTICGLLWDVLAGYGDQDVWGQLWGPTSCGAFTRYNFNFVGRPWG